MIDRDALIEALIANAYNLYSSTLVANRAPCNEALYRLLTNPCPGDLVLEISKHPAGHASIGVLVSVSGDDWVIRDIDECEQHWHNATFIRVLEYKVDAIEEARKRGLYFWRSTYE